MKQNYTEEKLIQFIYGECDIFDTLEIEHALQEDLFLKENFNEIYTSYKALPKLSFTPYKSTIQSILSISNESLELIH